MKRIMNKLIVLIVTLMSLKANAQSINIKLGYSNSNVKFSGLEQGESSYESVGGVFKESINRRTVGGFNAAVGYEFGLSQRLSIFTGLNYQKRGFQIDQITDFSNNDVHSSSSSLITANYRYLDLPIVLNTSIFTRENLKVYARTGVYVGCLLAANYRDQSTFIESDGAVYSYDESYKIVASEISFLDGITAGVLTGVGIEYRGFYLETNLKLGPQRLSNLGEEIFMRDLNIMLGYKFKLN